VVNTGPDRSGADSHRAARHRTGSRRAAFHGFGGIGLYGQHGTVLGAIRDSAQGAVQQIAHGV